jgi:four helix bundle protein
VNELEFKDKAKHIAIRIIRLVESLPKNATTDVIGKQLLRSATSVGANYRSACRAKSSADMIAKLAIVEEEADESMYWIELLIELNLVTSARLADLVSELNEVVAITVASIKTLRGRKQS